MLRAAEAFYRPLFHHIVVAKMPDHQRRAGIVPAAVILRRTVIAPDGIAIDTAVQTAFIGADVDALDAIADMALVRILLRRDRIARNAFDQPAVDAHAGRDAQVPKVDLCGAGLQCDRRRRHCPAERHGHPLDFVPLQGPDAERPENASMQVVV